MAKELIEGNVVDFKVNQQLIYIRRLGSGGTGEVCLFYEELTDKKYAIKKFSPLPVNDNQNAFQRFLDEIKILVDLYHKNIVRIYTYYLYPNLKTGFLQMEYIDGVTIDAYLETNPQDFDSLFLMAIDAFDPAKIPAENAEVYKYISVAFDDKLEGYYTEIRGE